MIWWPPVICHVFVDVPLVEKWLDAVEVVVVDDDDDDGGGYGEVTAKRSVGKKFIKVTLYYCFY